ncbi:hypothetical protein BJX63DRAFT_379526 [Aspergillus granulosus]|uniref:BHLH domain-containing protein n=1 Tax=Aspergillus granulosus TaxID=176169 RepID=A0ABR4I084_9EURO
MEWSRAGFFISEAFTSGTDPLCASVDQKSESAGVFFSKTTKSVSSQIHTSPFYDSLESKHLTDSPQIWSRKSCTRRGKPKHGVHRVIEKRYRDNMKSKFEQLEKLICRRKNLPAPLNRPDILTCAMVYIQEMEAENLMLQQKLEFINESSWFPGADNSCI